MNVSRLGAALLLAILLAGLAVQAQNPDPNDKTDVHPLTLEPHSGIANGRIAMVEGEAGPEGVRLVVNKLSLLQPAAVALVAFDNSDDLRLALWKYAEDDQRLEASTRNDGYASFMFRTEDDLQLRIVSPNGPKRYRLAVWAGDEVELPLPSPFVALSSAAPAGGTPAIMYVLTAGVVAIALLLGVIVLRKKNVTPALLLLPGMLALESAPTPVSGTDWLVDAAQKAAGIGKAAAPGPTGKAFGWFEDAIGKGKAGKDALDSYDALSKGDKALDPNYHPAGSPAVPSHCTAPDGKGGEGCNDCYAAAHRKLNAVRTAFEKLRRVGTTTRAFAAKSIAFGDSVSGVHGVAGLGWQPERAKIEQSMKGFEQAYDAKHAELVGLLEAALREIGQCEARHFNVPDWYDRYGFMYYTFMADRYKAP
jgi:hypothetical protein